MTHGWDGKAISYQIGNWNCMCSDINRMGMKSDRDVEDEYLQFLIP